MARTHTAWREFMSRVPKGREARRSAGFTTTKFELVLNLKHWHHVPDALLIRQLKRDRQLCPVAAASCRRELDDRGDLPVRSKPGSAAMALDLTGQYLRSGDLDHRFTALLLVHLPFRKLQQDLRIARGGNRLHDLDLDIDHGHPGRRQDQRRARTSNRGRHHGRSSGATRQARRSNGGCGWAKLLNAYRVCERSSPSKIVSVLTTFVRTPLFIAAQLQALAGPAETSPSARLDAPRVKLINCLTKAASRFS
jgi:hypothetical protein